VNLLKIAITCYPSVGGSGILASALGESLARRGHEVHFISYERPFRLPDDLPRLFFHSVGVSDYGLFKYPDYTLPLSVKMAEVSRDYNLDILHVHYAVPHATAAILARAMLPKNLQPRIITTLHGTDTTLLGRDADYGPAIRHALENSDAVTTVSDFLRRETHRLLNVEKPIDVIHNFFDPRKPHRPRGAVRADLGIQDHEAMILHISNLRPLKRVDLLLETAALLRPRDAFKLVILAGESFAPFSHHLRQLGIEDRVIVRERVNHIEDYLQAADLGLFTSETESFCLSILEAMCFGVPSVATAVGGIPEVVEHTVTGLLIPFDPANHAAPSPAPALARAVESLLHDPLRLKQMSDRAQRRALTHFSADAIVSQYESLYHRVLEHSSQ
jgi:N-acetyl-alpha-D-glucosaminyl L-malate synthase BshA